MADAARVQPAPRRAADVELLWDLVFAFAVTNVTALLGPETSWPAAGRTLLVLALVWWAWSAFAWVANVHDQESLSFKLTMLAATGLVFLVALAIPDAFGRDADLFVACYSGVRVLHLALYAQLARRGRADWRAISGFAVTVAVGISLLVCGAQLGDTDRAALWVVAAVIDYSGPALLTRRRLRELQRVAVDHFAERYGTFVIICLGESIVSVGAAAGSHPDGSRVAVVAVTLAITAGLWWTYFDISTRVTQALRTSRNPVLAAADGYSYLHLPLIAGILLFAAGARAAVTNPVQPLDDPVRLSLCAGIALYFGAHAVFHTRMTRRVPTTELAAGAVAFAVYPATPTLGAWSVAALLFAILAAALILGQWADHRAKHISDHDPGRPHARTRPACETPSGPPPSRTADEVRRQTGIMDFSPAVTSAKVGDEPVFHELPLQRAERPRHIPTDAWSAAHRSNQATTDARTAADQAQPCPLD